MKLQLALDELSLDEALRLACRVRDDIDIFEIGTPFLLAEGLHAVRRFKDEFPDKQILADAKMADGGTLETHQCFDAGADLATILAFSDLATAKAAAAAAEGRGRIVADMICVEDLDTRTQQMLNLGITDIAVHTGVDQQKAGRTPLADLQLIRAAAPQAHIFVAGGINLNNVQDYLNAGADVIIVGGAVAHARDPEEIAHRLGEIVHGG